MDEPVFDWKLSMAIDGLKHGLIMYRDNALGVQMEVFTPKNKGTWGKEERTYYLDDDKTTYHSENELREALKKRGER